MDKAEAIAGLLSTLHGSDRRWILRRLPAVQRRRLRLAMKHLPRDLSKLRDDIGALVRPAPMETVGEAPGDLEALQMRRRMADPILRDLPRELQGRIKVALGLVEGADEGGAQPTERARAAMIRHLPPITGGIGSTEPLV